MAPPLSWRLLTISSSLGPRRSSQISTVLFLRNTCPGLLELYWTLNSVGNAKEILIWLLMLHKKGLCWNGKWKAEHMKVRNDIKDFVITEVPNDTTSKEGMQADFRNFFEIIFPYYEHEEIDSASGEKKKVLPCYFLQFQHNCIHEREKLEKFQRFLGCHPAFMSPAALSTLICHLYRDCDSLRKPQDTVYEPLQVSETLLIEWRGVRHFGIPFSNVYWHFFVDVYELGYWFLLKYLRNFIEHAHRYTKVNTCFCFLSFFFYFIQVTNLSTYACFLVGRGGVNRRHNYTSL